MRVVTRNGVVVSVAGLALVLSACSDDGNGGAGDGAGGNDSDQSGSVVIAGCNPQNALLPAMTSETCGGDPLDAIFSNLTRYDPDTAEPVNEIAESFETEDNITWTVRLKDGWTFHDGSPVTAQSFVDAWNWGAYAPNATLSSYFYGCHGLGIQGAGEIGGPALCGPNLDANGDGEVAEDEAPATEMSGLEVIDDLTFRITLDNPRPDLPTIVGYRAFAPLPESFFDDPDAFGDHPVGSGPFEVVEYAKEREIVLQAYDGYQGEMKPHVENVTFRIYQDLNAAYADLQSDTVDVHTHLPQNVLAGDQYKEDLGDRVIERETGIIQTITFAPPSVSPELNNADLHKAVSMAIDRQLVIDTLFHGAREPATSWVAPVVDGFKPDQCGQWCTYDADKARDRLEASGFDGELTLAYNADGDHQGWVDAICNSISNTLGIECTGAPEVDFATFRAKITKRELPGMFATGWRMDYPTIENFLGPLYATGAGSNDADWSNPQFDRLLNRASSAAERTESIRLYQQAETLLAEDMHVIPLWYGKTIAGYSNNVDNVKITPFSTVDLLSISTA